EVREGVNMVVDGADQQVVLDARVNLHDLRVVLEHLVEVVLRVQLADPVDGQDPANQGLTGFAYHITHEKSPVLKTRCVAPLGIVARASEAMSSAPPPPPNRRTPPSARGTSVALALPKTSTSSAPRKPTSTRPRWSSMPITSRKPLKIAARYQWRGSALPTPN